MICDINHVFSKFIITACQYMYILKAWKSCSTQELSKSRQIKSHYNLHVIITTMEKGSYKMIFLVALMIIASCQSSHFSFSYIIYLCFCLNLYINLYLLFWLTNHMCYVSGELTEVEAQGRKVPCDNDVDCRGFDCEGIFPVKCAEGLCKCIKTPPIVDSVGIHHPIN